MKCRLCPRACNALRTEENLGYCRSPWQLTAARASLHMWEEPVISGVYGSGTVFFSGCSLGCVFCQNESLALAESAKEITIEKLADVFLKLQERGAHNINLVTGSHYVVQLAKALRLAKKQGLTIPVVYNTSSYENVKTLRLLEGLVDIYLPDMKYYDRSLAKRYSNAPDYFEIAMAAIKEMYRQVGSPRFEEFDPLPLLKKAKAEGIETTSYYEEGDELEKTTSHDEEGEELGEMSSYDEEFDEQEEPALLMKKGVIIRHLLLPGCLHDSKRIVKELYECFGNEVYLSLMNQYTPCNELTDYPELKKTVSEEEYDALVDYAIDLGVENGFIQEGETNLESFIPTWDYQGLD